ncbi:MAG: phosphatase [bacterium]|nr:phosphatase [bacterium]
MLKEIKGDLITLAKEGQFDVIVHGCNCQGIMGKGLAKHIKAHFPKAAKIDSKGNSPGTIGVAKFPTGLHVVNAYTQIYPGKTNKKPGALSPINEYRERVTDSRANRYAFIRHCMKEIKVRFGHLRIGLPLIGCGLAGCDVTVVHY